MSKGQILSATKWLQKQHHVWIKALPQYPNPNEDAFLQGKVIQVFDKQVFIQLIDSESKVKAPIQNVLKLTYSANDVADMVDLQQLNQPQLLFNIKRRYVNDQIFTYCGPTLVIVNPYAYIQKLMNDSVLQENQTMVFSDNLQYKSMPPHVFSLACFCLWQLFDNQRSQSIVISGESGAGKTENTKSCLKFLASLGKNMKEYVNHLSKADPTKSNKKINSQNLKVVEKMIKKTNSKIYGIEEKILGCNQILQAFGNSKTIRNDNSSRFGKLVLLLYGETQIDIRSAFIISYLLQKSRIVSVSDGERNYHIFYYFCKGTTVEEKKQFKLNDPMNKYYYLNQSTVYDLPKSSDEAQYQQMKKQFQLYLIPQQTNSVYRILSIVLNNGNIMFEKSENKNNEQIVTIKNEQYLKSIAELLQVNYEALKHCFEFKTRKTGNSIINSPLKYDEAIALRDSFSKNIYQKVFNFLVEKLNQSIQIQKIDFEGTESRQKRKSIGLLDIFGFQVLLINSLEQFFINFANEKLQQLYVSYIFKEEQNEFLREGLKEFSHNLGFQDNKPIIDCLELYPLGLFHLINQSSELNKPDENLPEVMLKNHKNAFFLIPKGKRGQFQINHSCSPVIYSTSGFTSKNKDEFPRQLFEVICTSTNQYLKKIIVGNEKEEQAKSKKPSNKFLGSKFLGEMNKLIEQLYSCDCHFVRCIKPNSKKSPKLFNSDAVLQSLKYLGVLDSIKIRKLGYIYRRPYKQFYKKFYEIKRYIFSYQTDIQGKVQDDFKEESHKIVEQFAKKQGDNKDILFGVKKILIKQSALNHLQLLGKQRRRLRIQTANRMKTAYKNGMFRGQVKALFKRIALLKSTILKLTKDIKNKVKVKRVLRIQNIIRKFLWHRRLQRNKVQATKLVNLIAKYWRMKKERKKYLQIRKSIQKIQCNIRSFITLSRYTKKEMGSVIFRFIIEKAWQNIEQKKAQIIQKTWRGHKVRKQLRSTIKRMKVRIMVKKAVVKLMVNSFTQILQMYKKPVIKMQAIVRGRYCRRIYKQLKKSTKMIQDTYRKHLRKRLYVQKIWKKEKQVLESVEKEKERQLSKIGLLTKIEENRKVSLNETSRLPQKLSPIQLKTYFKPHIPEQPRDMLINQTINFSDKNTMQIYLADIDIISTLTYRGQWAAKYSNLKAEFVRKQQYPLRIDVGQSFTCVVTNKDRVYSFGQYVPGDQYQFSKTEIKNSIHSVCINDESVYIITKQFELYEWGDNKNGQLFMDNNQKTVRLSHTNSISSTKDVEVRGSQRYYVDCQGKTYSKNNDRIKLISFGLKVQVNFVVTSYSFTHFVSMSGQLYSMGSNKLCQLGLDISRFDIHQPTLNQYFVNKKEMIDTVSVGIGHSVVRTKLGYVYSWGDNRSGQVALQKTDVIHIPIVLEQDKQKLKALQAVASLRATYLLLQNLSIIGLGLSSSFNTIKTSNYAQVDLLNVQYQQTQLTHSNPKNLIPLKISTSWNRQISILTVNCIEQSNCKTNSKSDVIIKYCKTIAKDWPIKSIYPQYTEWMDNILNLSDMRKFKFQKNMKPKTNNNVNSNKLDSELDELKVLMDLRKTSTLFKAAVKNKIQSIIKKLGSKPQKEWTKEDEEINNYIKEHCNSILR